MAVWPRLLPQTLLYAAVIGLFAVVLFRLPNVGEYGIFASLDQLQVINFPLSQFGSQYRTSLSAEDDGRSLLQRSRNQWGNGIPSQHT
jgi:hypothetical protein